MKIKNILKTICLLFCCCLLGCANGTQQQAIQPHMVFDVPSLIGKNLNEVQAILGPPIVRKGEGPWQPGTNDDLVYWAKEGATLLVQFDRGNGVIRYFYIAVDRKSDVNSFENEEAPLILGNLRKDDSRYRLKIVPDKEHPGRVYGAKAVPVVKIIIPVLPGS